MCRITLMESVRQVAQWNHEAKQITDKKYTYKGIIAEKKDEELYCRMCIKQSKQVTVKLRFPDV